MRHERSRMDEACSHQYRARLGRRMAGGRQAAVGDLGVRWRTGNGGRVARSCYFSDRRVALDSSTAYRPSTLRSAATAECSSKRAFWW